MSAGFGFAALTRETEAGLVRDLALRPVALDPSLAAAEGTWKSAPVAIETRAYRGDRIQYARFVVIRGGGLEIGNVLCLSDPTYPLPILGADLVALGQEQAMLAADLSPVLPAGAERDAQLAPLLARRARWDQLPGGGALPDWCSDWFSPAALYTRIAHSQLDRAVAAFRDFPRSFIELAFGAAPRPDLAAGVAAVQAGYAAAHRTEDKGLRLLAKMFGAAWAERYTNEILFPATREPA